MRLGGHFSGRAVADAVERSTRLLSPGRGARTGRGPRGGDCLTLHAMGFSVPRASPPGRWALTPPFHPCLIPRFRAGHRRSDFLWHCPAPASRRRVRVGVTHHRVLSCSDFPPALGQSPSAGGHHSTPVLPRSMFGRARPEPMIVLRVLGRGSWGECPLRGFAMGDRVVTPKALSGVAGPGRSGGGSLRSPTPGYFRSRLRRGSHGRRGSREARLSTVQSRYYVPSGGRLTTPTRICGHGRRGGIRVVCAGRRRGTRGVPGPCRRRACCGTPRRGRRSG